MGDMKARVVSFHTVVADPAELVVIDQDQEVMQVEQTGGRFLVTIATYSTVPLVRTEDGRLVTEAQARLTELVAKTVV